MTHQGPRIHPVIVPTSTILQSFNFYVVESDGALILIDAGLNSKSCWAHFNQVMNANGFEAADIDKIILTHSHDDHTGIVHHLLSEHDIPVYAHKNAAPRLNREWAYLHHRLAFFDQFYEEMGCRERGREHVALLRQRANEKESQALNTDISPLQEGDVIDGFEVIETPGHWPDHIVLCHRESGDVFAGDHILGHISSNAMMEPDTAGNKQHALLEYEHSLKKCTDYALQTAYTGHGGVVENPIALIERRLRGIDRKSEKIRTLIGKRQPCTADTLARAFYEKAYDREFSLVISEIAGHLDRLETHQRVTKRKVDAEWVYSLS
ncbi:MBL fold metallo-hydrolase [Lentibacillus halophilus]|uniref:MBL fold metallo-hydrolase n=1 Tax=Lentibacillus halophilus TaxID=295065 RepID=A0ABP3J2Q3_9BACI